MPKKKLPSFEHQFARLEAIVESLEAGDVALEESLSLYAEGMELVGVCGEKLATAAQRIERIDTAMRAKMDSGTSKLIDGQEDEADDGGD